MEPMSVLLTIWAVLTTALVVLLIYRTVLTMHEDINFFWIARKHTWRKNNSS